MLEIIEFITEFDLICLEKIYFKQWLNIIQIIQIRVKYSSK